MRDGVAPGKEGERFFAYEGPAYRFAADDRGNSCALSRPPKEGHLRVPEIPANVYALPGRRQAVEQRGSRPFSIVISPKGASWARGTALPGGTSQSGFCQLIGAVRSALERDDRIDER